MGKMAPMGVRRILDSALFLIFFEAIIICLEYVNYLLTLINFYLLLNYLN